MCESLWRADYRANPKAKADRKSYFAEFKAKHARLNSDPAAVDREKHCPVCDKTKPAVEFHKATKRRGGLASQCRACDRAYVAAYIGKLKEQVFDLLGHSCVKCNFSDKRALQIDPVFGGGNKEHAEIKNNAKFLKKVIAEASSGTYQILCANHNWIKRYEKDENPIGKRIAA